MQSTVNTVAQVEPIANQFPSPVNGNVSPIDPRIRLADHSLDDNITFDEEDTDFD